MTAGDHIRISNPRRGAVDAVLTSITPAEELPDLGPDYPPAWLVRRVLRQWNASRVALIEYLYGPPDKQRHVRFAALEIRGRWYDLHRQELTITTIQEPTS